MLSTSQAFFIGRTSELQCCQNFLNSETPWVLIITGIGGSGKSAFLHQWIQQLPDENCVVLLDFTKQSLQTDALKFLKQFVKQIAAYCDSEQIRVFRTNLWKDSNRLLQLSKQIDQELHLDSGASLQMAQLNMRVASAIRNIQYQVREQATEAFYELLSKSCIDNLLLVLDSCEWLGESENIDVSQWVMNELLPEMHRRMPHKFSVVIASRARIRLTAIDKQDQYHMALPLLNMVHIEQYLAHEKIHGSSINNIVFDISYGNPICIQIVNRIIQDRGRQTINSSDLSILQQTFYKHAMLAFVSKHIMDGRLQSPFRELTYYGVLLRDFDLPLLQAVFPELLPESKALEIFEHFTDYSHIIYLGNNRYAVHALVREILIWHIRERERDAWQLYYSRALEYFTHTSPKSFDWYYYALAFEEEQGISAWKQAIDEAKKQEAHQYRQELLQILTDRTLKLSTASKATSLYERGSLYQEKKQWEKALESYEQALIIYKELKDRSGEAYCYEAEGHIALDQKNYDKALHLFTQACKLYQHTQDGYSLARLLYFRSLVHQAMDEKQNAMNDAERSLEIAQDIDHPDLNHYRRHSEAICNKSY